MDIELSQIKYWWKQQHTRFFELEKLCIAKGEKILILGSSGSGKTTLLNLVCGNILSQRGEVRIGKNILNNVSPQELDKIRANHFGIIFQQFNLIPYLTGIENILLPLYLSSVKKNKVKNFDQEARDLVKKLDLNIDDVFNNKPSQISVGQQQRIAAARALIGKPEIIIADEPTSSLDEVNKNIFLETLMAQTSELNSTLLLVSHDKSLSSMFKRVIDISKICSITRSQHS